MTQRVSPDQNYLVSGYKTEHRPEIQRRCMENDTCLAEQSNASAGSLKTSPEVFSSAIEFYVWSDEGVNLYVDLNSSPLNWTERFKTEVYICKSMYRDKCLQQNLCWFEGHKEIANFFQWNKHAGLIKGDYLQKKTLSSSNLMMSSCMEIDQLDEADGSVISAMMSHKADSSEHLDEDQRINSSETDVDVQNQKFAGSESCDTEDSCAINLDLDINDALEKKANCDPISGGSSSLDMLEHQNSMLESEICETSTRQKSCSILNFSVENSGSSAAGPMDMQSSDIEQCSKDLSCLPCRAHYHRETQRMFPITACNICREVGKVLFRCQFFCVLQFRLVCHGCYISDCQQFFKLCVIISFIMIIPLGCYSHFFSNSQFLIEK